MMDFFDTYEAAVARLLKARTEEEATAARISLRPWCKGSPVRQVMWGFRQQRKRRAGTDFALRRPTASELQQAREMLRQGRRAHEIETYFAETYNVRISRNRLSKMCGARP
jgi:hypothetical protein